MVLIGVLLAIFMKVLRVWPISPAVERTDTKDHWVGISRAVNPLHESLSTLEPKTQVDRHRSSTVLHSIRRYGTQMANLLLMTNQKLEKATNNPLSRRVQRHIGGIASASDLSMLQSYLEGARQQLIMRGSSRYRVFLWHGEESTVSASLNSKLRRKLSSLGSTSSVDDNEIGINTLPLFPPIGTTVQNSLYDYALGHSDTVVLILSQRDVNAIIECWSGCRPERRWHAPFLVFMVIDGML